MKNGKHITYAEKDFPFPGENYVLVSFRMSQKYKMITLQYGKKLNKQYEKVN
jgi:hypothetical protein